MPIYEYTCEDCGTSFERLVRSMSAGLQAECPKCRSKRCRKSISRFGAISGGVSKGSDAACSSGGG